MTKKEKIMYWLKTPWFGGFISLLVTFLSNYYLQLSQNEWSFKLATKFAFSWHTEKFLLGTLVLFALNLLLVSLSGSFKVGNIFYSVSIIFLGIANNMKMSARMEPIYPDDLKMLFEWSMLRDILGLPLFILFLVIIVVVLLWFGLTFKKSLELPLRKQKARVMTLLLSTLFLVYASNFNQPNNLLKKAYDRTALWIPYSQKMNYYNTGFMGGFLFNLNVEGMDKPANYSRQEMDKIVKEYNGKAEKTNEDKKKSKQPNIVYVMSESFSDPSRLKGIEFNADPLKKYREITSDASIHGQMLSQNYGGGTANIEFEALTGFSMALLNPQMTTPYTMMLPKEKAFPSIVSTLKEQNYQTTAIHPYNTSMYKRKDVYQTFGFDQFLDEKTMKHQEKLSKNGFISDQSAFDEILDVLADPNQPQFVHLVTMQTHMPYTNKYASSDYQVKGMENSVNIDNYAQDIAYTTEALEKFISELDKLERPTTLVFWGDHLPGIYSEETLKENTMIDTHLTEYFIYDTKENGPGVKETISPFYFPSMIGQTDGVKATGFNELLREVHEILPAFEKEMYFHENDWQKEVQLSKEEQAIFDTYQLVQYDIVSGEKYSLKLF
ncbi:LTA synthase family protein [Vagococcus hydrophili]|uniref:LTA synthase family protein n=1 Tax=Vagococcus hydrophili TaxID=2714947 RepID=A0A6G8APU9_9ENTE|nr:LTA synthase family protein [Vagococcus hydrophili]QIL47101.1 LTA synthase family protein [Vagococcus hydrophili]